MKSVWHCDAWSVLKIGLISLVCTSAVHAEQVMRFESVVTGNQEQPKVMFVMPWQPIPIPNYEPEQAVLLMPKRLLQPYNAQSLHRFSERALIKVAPFVINQELD